MPDDVAASNFLASWLVARDYARAAAYFAPRTAGCSAIATTGVTGFLRSVADEIPKRPDLAEAIKSVPFGHPHLQRVSDPQGSSFLLTRVSTELARTLECASPTLSRDAVSGAPVFDGTAYRTDFALRDAEGEAGAVSLLWRFERRHWRIVAVAVTTE